MASFTYLIPADEIYPGKTISFLPDGSVQQIKPAHSTDVYAERYMFNDFSEMCGALYAMVDDRRGYIVRADVSPEYMGKRRMFKRRLGKMGSEYVLWRYDPQWICLDIDGIPKPDHIDPVERPEEAIAYVLESLPPYFKDVSCWWQFSSSQSLPGSRDLLKVHLFYMLTNAIPEKKLKEWAASNKQKHYIDPAVMLSNQPIYIAPPNLRGGKDWMKTRCGTYTGAADILDLNLFVSRSFNKESRVIPIDQRKILAKYLDGRIGDGEGRLGFNDPIKSAVAAVIAKAGAEIDREQLKADLRNYIKEAPTYEHRTGRPKDEYLDDRYLDPLIEAIILREAESQSASQNQYDIARNRFVYITNINRFYDQLSGNYITKEALNMALAKIGRSLADVFVNDTDFLVVDQLTYYPGKEKICTEISIDTGEKVLCFNIYQPPIINDEPADKAAFFVEHVRKLAGDEEVFGHMMDWMAHNVQKPGVKIMYAMLIQGKQGTGKSALMEAMKGAMGEQNVRSIETHELLGNFNSWAKGKAMIVVEEIRDSTDRFGIYNRIKPIVTAPTITLNEKNISGTPMRNRMNVMAFTNYETAVPMDDDDRRFFIHFSPMEPELPEYYDKLFELIARHPGAIRKVLLEWDISAFNPNGRAPMTEAKKFLQEYAGNPVEKLLRVAQKEKEWPLKYDLICIKDLINALQPQYKVSDQTVSVMLRRLGMVSIGRKYTPGGRKALWVVRDLTKWIHADEITIGDHYKPPYYDNQSKSEGYIGENTKGVPTY